MPNSHGLDSGRVLPMTLRRAYLLLHRETEAALAGVGVTAEQFVLLAALAHADSATQQDLVRRTTSDPNTVRAMLIILERRDLVRRMPHPSDRRARTVTLTESGRRAYSEAWIQTAAIRSEIAGALSAEEAAALTRLLDRVTDALS
jgi:DNA-binding MarR family transcriptional regulator